MKKANNFMMNLLKPNSGVSSKRFISVGGFILLAFIALVDLFTNLTVSDYVYEGLVFAVLGGIGGSAAEAYGNRNKTSTDYTSTTKTTKTIETPPGDAVEKT